MSHLRKILVSIMLALALLPGLSALASQSAFAEEPDQPASSQLRIANTDYYPGDLYASIIYSESSEVESADGVELSFDYMMKYPASRDDHKVYGRMERPDWKDEGKVVGGQLVSQMRTLYDYGWFEPLPQEQDNWISRIFQTVIDTATDNVSSRSARISLNAAIWGATAYDMGSSLRDFFAESVQWLDIVQILGLRPQDGRSSWLENILMVLARSVGLNAQFVQMLATFTLMIVVAIAIIATMRALSAGSGRAQIDVAKRWWVRIAVALATVTLSTWTTAAFQSLDSRIEAVNEDLNHINAGYIVDSLAFASYTNFNMAAINPSGSLKADGSVSEDYAPTRSRVARVNETIIANQHARGGYLKPEESASAMLEKFISGEVATVADYFSALASQQCSVRQTATSCTRSPGQIGSFDNFDSGIPNNHLYNTAAVSNAPYFILENRQGEESGSSSSSGEEAQTNVNEVKVTMSGQEFTINKNTKYTVKPFDFRNPQSYLYGATPPGNLSKATREYANYINDEARSIQWIDPETGKRVGESGNDTSGAMTKEKAIRNNSLHMAIYNRYAGLEAQSFSDQSTAFFLQTKRSGENSIVYKGYYTAPNADGEAKNVGRYGNAFIRYTMPTTSTADYYFKIGSLNVMWTISGVLSIAALLILLRAPVFGSLAKTISGFFSAVLTGNPVGMVQHLVYKIALALAFIFADLGTRLGLLLGKNVLADNPWVASYFGKQAMVDGTVGMLLSTNQMGVPSLSVLVPLVGLGALFCVTLCWPFVKIGDRPVSLMGMIIGAPFLIAESTMDKFSAYGARELGVRQQSAFSRATRADRKAARETKNASRPAPVRALRTGAKLAGAVGVGAALSVATGGAGTGMVAGALTKGVKNKGLRYALNNVAQKGITGLAKSGVGQVAGKGLKGFGQTLGYAADKVRGAQLGTTAEGFVKGAHRLEESAQIAHLKDSPWYERYQEGLRAQRAQEAAERAAQAKAGAKGKGGVGQTTKPVDSSAATSDPLVVSNEPGNEVFFHEGRYVDLAGNPIDGSKPVDVKVDIDGNPVVAGSVDGSVVDAQTQAQASAPGNTEDKSSVDEQAPLRDVLADTVTVDSPAEPIQVSSGSTELASDSAQVASSNAELASDSAQVEAPASTMVEGVKVEPVSALETGSVGPVQVEGVQIDSQQAPDVQPVVLDSPESATIASKQPVVAEPVVVPSESVQVPAPQSQPTLADGVATPAPVELPEIQLPAPPQVAPAEVTVSAPQVAPAEVTVSAPASGPQMVPEELARALADHNREVAAGTVINNFIEETHEGDTHQVTHNLDNSTHKVFDDHRTFTTERVENTISQMAPAEASAPLGSASDLVDKLTQKLNEQAPARLADKPQSASLVSGDEDIRYLGRVLGENLTKVGEQPVNKPRM